MDNTMNIPTVTTDRIPDYLAAGAAVRRPVILWGSPGASKSAQFLQYTRSISGMYVDIRLANYDAVDMRGLPDLNPERGTTVWRPPETLPIVGNDAFPDDIPIVLGFDELLQAPGAVQSVAFQIMLDGKVGEHDLKPNVIVFAASNRETDRAGVNRMLSPLANRLLHLNVKPTFDAWKQWAIPAGVHPIVLGYLSFQEHHLDMFEEAAKANAKAYPTPRSWHFVSDLMWAVEDVAVRNTMIAAAIGEGVASSFTAFARQAEVLPNYREIVADPHNAKLPEANDMLFAISSMITVQAKPEDADALITYVRRMPEEYQTVWLSDIARSRTDVALASDQIMAMQAEHHRLQHGGR